MDRFTVHTALNTLSALGLFGIAGVLYLNFGIDIYSAGFVAVGLLTLYRALSPVLSDSRPQSISDARMALDVISVVLVSGTLAWLLVG